MWNEQVPFQVNKEIIFTIQMCVVWIKREIERVCRAHLPYKTLLIGDFKWISCMNHPVSY